MPVQGSLHVLGLLDTEVLAAKCRLNLLLKPCLRPPASAKQTATQHRHAVYTYTLAPRDPITKLRVSRRGKPQASPSRPRTPHANKHKQSKTFFEDQLPASASATSTKVEKEVGLHTRSPLGKQSSHLARHLARNRQKNTGDASCLCCALVQEPKP